MTPAQFAKRMRKIAANIVANTDAGHRATALAVDQALVFSTPVDTGRARSNWQVSWNNPIRSTREAYAPGKDGMTGSANTSAALAQAAAVLNGNGKGNVIYISNNLAYITALNEGHSAQAPAGFVEIAVQHGVEAIKRIKLLKET